MMDWDEADPTPKVLVDIEPNEVEEFLEGIVWKRIVHILKEMVEGNKEKVNQSLNMVLNDIGISISIADSDGRVTTKQMTTERFAIECAALAARREVLEEILEIPADLLTEAREMADKRAAKEEEES